MVINRNTLVCEVCSGNISNVVDLTLEDVLGAKAHDVFGEGFGQLLQPANEDVPTIHSVIVMGKKFLVSIHCQYSQFIVEAEPEELFGVEHVDLYKSSSNLLDAMEKSSTIIELANSVAIAIRELTKYDRVMIYRFDSEYNGEVIAEAKHDDLTSFLNLHYPSTDIPAQARALYLKNQLRLIADVNYQPEPLFAFEKSNISDVDLSMSSLRSVSPIHIQYLKNMGVGATLTVSLVHNGKLWGLIACHHRTEKLLSYSMKTAVKLQGHFITSQIDVRVRNEEYEISVQANQCVEQLLAKKLETVHSSFKVLYDDAAIIDLCNSNGACALIGSDVFTFGITPEIEKIKMLSNYLHEASKSTNISTNNSSEIIGDLAEFTDQFPGLVFFSLGNEIDCLMWFRQPVITEITWAGELKNNSSGSAPLTPRHSFEHWTQKVKDKSRPWLASEINAIKHFFNFFQMHSRAVLLNKEKERHRKLSEVLEEANAEIDNINWISTHDLQEPLRKIRMMTSILISEADKELPEKMMARIVKVQTSAERMQSLIKDIIKYTKSSRNVEKFVQVELNDVLSNVLKEMDESLSARNIKLEIAPMPVVDGVSFLLNQVFSNVLYNAVKFSDEKKQSFIKVKSNAVEIEGKTFYQIDVIDNGIGFDNEYNEKIFNIFSRLHSVHEYKGTGVGLSLCRKIMKKHNGFVTATGELGQGATFSLLFPYIEYTDVAQLTDKLAQ